MKRAGQALLVIGIALSGRLDTLPSARADA